MVLGGGLSRVKVVSMHTTESIHTDFREKHRCFSDFLTIRYFRSINKQEEKNSRPMMTDNRPFL